ncbi:MAG: iron-sulfur cluster insertion protein ErpA [Bacillaceae bacterium]|nr:iron-sulfur cluster insertion protein ErpA [Bacillaceae bacterium]
MITITESAGQKIKELLAEEDNDQLFLRVGVKPGGCSGFSYGMGFDDTIHEHDQEFEQHGIKVVVDAGSAPYLKGAEIDYKENMMGGGFSIHNPNAVSSCGCGSSFRTADDAGQPSEC